ncbi:MAG: cytochrome-c peroxidase [Saprospiraceae bacterium]|nr:cytochrome-c peroxidase [Saprospiraceae bacterium]
MKRTFQLCVLGFALALVACQKDEQSAGRIDETLLDLLQQRSDGAGLSHYMLPASDDFEEIPQDPNNPLSIAKVELGKHLYHETGLAIHPKYPEGLGTYSCASCHHARAGFQAGRQQGIGDGGFGFGAGGEGRQPHSIYFLDSIDVQPIRTPSAMNGAYQPNQLWNGQFGATHLNIGTESNWTVGSPKEVNNLGYEGLETQAIAGLAVHRMGIDHDFCNNTSYKEYFQKAYPNLSDEQKYTNEYAGLAISAYERTLLANRAPFQQWLRGDRNAMFESEKRGAMLFFGKGKCYECHTGPALNAMEFHALGMPDLNGPGVYGTSPDKAENRGRGGFTGNPADNYKFKVPQLYNLKDSPFFGHGGTFTSVREIIAYKNAAQPANSAVPASQLAEEFIPLDLSEEEINDLTLFVENALYDADLFRYEPALLPSGNCFPNNDVGTKNDLGCE